MPSHMNPHPPEPIASHQGSIEALCRKYHVARLALFGSSSRGESQSDSDVDLLVVFEPGQTPGLGFFKLQVELEGVLGRPVDLNTQEDLSRYFRDQVLQEATVVYEG